MKIRCTIYLFYIFIAIVVLNYVVYAKGRIIVNSRNIMQHKDGNWQEKVKLNSSSVICGNEDNIFFQIRGNQKPRPNINLVSSINWGRWEIKKDKIILMSVFPKNIKPIQRLSNGTIIYHKPKYTSVYLYSQDPGKNRKLVYGIRGMMGYHYLDDKSHLYYIIPKMGKKESPYFIDYVYNSPATLYYKKTGLERKKLATRNTIKRARFVNDGKYIVYWRPGKVNKSENRKFWVIESIEIKSGKVKEIGKVANVIKGGGRGTPAHWFFEKSQWIMFEKKMNQKKVPLQYIVYNVVSGEKKMLKIPYSIANSYEKNQIFLPIGNIYSHVYHPYVVGKVANKLIIWNISDMKIIEEIPFPREGNYPLMIKEAIYLP